MNTITVDKEGFYVIRVTLSDDLYEQIKGVNIDELMMYAAYDDGEAESSQVRASWLGLINTWELLTLAGDKMEFGLKEFLMVGFLNAGTPLSLFLTRLILTLLMGGCNAGLGIAGLAVVASAVVFLIRRRK